MIPSAPLGTDAAAGPHSLGAASGAGRSAGPAAERRFRFELAAHPGSAAQARRLTRARLNGWAVCEDTCDTAALVVSELVTNAIVHTASRHIVCELHDGDDLVRIAVRDEGCAPGEPHPCAPRGEEEHGRGLLLVDALCHSWGTHEHGPGLLVWADLPREGDTAGTGTGPHNDLGWGARPKPGPAGGSGGEDDEADALHKADARYDADTSPRHDADARHHALPEHGDAIPMNGDAIPGHGTGASGHSDALPGHGAGIPRPDGARAARHDATPRHDGTPRHHGGEPWPPGAETWHLGRPRHDGSETLHYGAPWHDGTEVRYDGAEAPHHGTSRHHGSAPHHGTGGPWL